MKTPTFNDFLGESIKFNPKMFKDVKPGDTAYVVGSTEPYEVLATGTGKDFDKKLKQYDTDGTVASMKKYPSSFGMTKGDFDELDFIAVKRGNDTNLFTYDEGGAWVNR